MFIYLQRLKLFLEREKLVTLLQSHVAGVTFTLKDVDWYLLHLL